jgi:hypothetical protein
MTDVFDIASELEELRREKALKFRKPEGPKATGKCLWCGEELDDGRRWCDFACLLYWEKIQSRHL